jgi:hypothetical protein
MNALLFSLFLPDSVVSSLTRLSVLKILNTHVLKKKMMKHGNITTRSFRDERNNYSEERQKKLDGKG